MAGKIQKGDEMKMRCMSCKKDQNCVIIAIIKTGKVPRLKGECKKCGGKTSKFISKNKI